MVLIGSSFECDSNGCQIIKIDENHGNGQICISRGLAVVADITSFLTETIDKFWFNTPSERVVGGWYYAHRVEESQGFP